MPGGRRRLGTSRRCSDFVASGDLGGSVGAKPFPSVPCQHQRMATITRQRPYIG